MKIRCQTCDGQFEFDAATGSADTQCPTCGSTIEVVQETTTFVPKQLRNIAHFQLLERIGAGQFGVVWKANDTKLKRLVALKLPRTTELDDASVTEFLREARNSSCLKHPNIVAIHDVGRDNGTAYIVSELIQGITLSKWLTTHKPAPQQTAAICARIAEALHHAHQKGIVHRDLKPANVMLDEHNEPHIMDFGLAKRDSAETTITIDGAILGTAAYMSPEQARGDAFRADARSDVYSLGVVLYEMLTGQRPFRGEMSLLLHKIASQEPPLPRSLDPKVPRDLETICLKAIAKDPAGRYQTAAAMAEDLRRFLDGEPVLARRISPLERAIRWVRRNRTAAASALVATLALLTLAVALIFRNSAKPEPGPVSGVSGGANPPQAAAGTIVLDTRPSKADVYFIRLDDATGEPDPATLRKAPGKSPVRLVLPKGDYLVVAVKPDEGVFHEVYRRTPGNGGLQKGSYAHNSWEHAADGTIRLPTIHLSHLSPNHIADVDEMARFDGNPEFAMGIAGSNDVPMHRRRVAAFFMDPAEVSVQDFERRWRRKRNRLRCIAIGGERRGDPVTCVTWDEAVAYAEVAGKRLPTEAEYEFAATNGGRRRFPWGEQPRAKWDFGLTREPPDDVLTQSGRPVFGLYSNVAEWTSSRYVPYPGVKSAGDYDSTMRVVRGGPRSVADGNPAAEQARRGPRQRFGVPWIKPLPKLGFRCVRSVVPRTKRADF